MLYGQRGLFERINTMLLQCQLDDDPCSNSRHYKVMKSVVDYASQTNCEFADIKTLDREFGVLTMSGAFVPHDIEERVSSSPKNLLVI